jgi:hypothetical protein
MNDKDATMFNIAGQLHHFLVTEKTPLIDDEEADGPVVQILADFLVRVVFTPSRRTVISPAETCFLLWQWAGREVQWPATFAETVQFLRSWWLNIGGVQAHSHIQMLWTMGFLFFGSAHVLRIAFKQLHIDAKRHLIISASTAFFRRSVMVRTTRHLTYGFFHLCRIEIIPTKTVMMYSRWPVLCAQKKDTLNFHELFSKLNQ